MGVVKDNYWLLGDGRDVITLRPVDRGLWRLCSEAVGATFFPSSIQYKKVAPAA